MVFSVLSWNIQGTTYFTKTTFNKIAPVIRALDADILCLQEGQRLRSNIGDFDKFHHFHRFFPKDIENRNIILSRFPIASSGELTFPKLRRRPLEKTIWANIKIGTSILRIYNCHFGIVGIGPAGRAIQLQYVLNDAKHYKGAVIICGDMNTTIPPEGYQRRIVQWFHRESNNSLLLDGKRFTHDERYEFVEMAKREGFHESINISKTTWCIPPFGWELFNLKLDWFLVRGVKTHKTVLGDYVSDHRSVLVECSVA